MTQSEQRQFDQLREELASTEQIKAGFSSAVDRLTEELRLYRGLFWSLLAIAAFALLVDLLHR
jgi:hypothetical protein